MSDLLINSFSKEISPKVSQEIDHQTYQGLSYNKCRQYMKQFRIAITYPIAHTKLFDYEYTELTVPVKYKAFCKIQPSTYTLEEWATPTAFVLWKNNFNVLCQIIFPKLEHLWKWELKDYEMYGTTKLTLYYRNIAKKPYGVGYDLENEVFVVFSYVKDNLIVYQSKKINQQYTRNKNVIKQRLHRFWQKNHDHRKIINFSGSGYTRGQKLGTQIVDLKYIL